MKILSVAGARPNFMKLASISNAIIAHNDSISYSEVNENDIITHVIVHTGQHYDRKMSKSFFVELGIPIPDINLEVGSGSHAQQTAEIMKRFEPVLINEQPDVLLLVGDVNSTIACALVAAKIQYCDDHHLNRPVIVHVEAGLRSFDQGMPEEINRILTDSLSDLLFITEESAEGNLNNEGVHADKVFFVGNVMIDTLIQHLEKAKKAATHDDLDITLPYGLVTLHRPSNVDNKEILSNLLHDLVEISQRIPLVFPVHPRTKNNIERFGLSGLVSGKQNLKLHSPMGYIDFLNMVQGASVVITDSGGVQEETTYLGVPCITLRDNTERPITVSEGSNYLTGLDPRIIKQTVYTILSGKGKKSQVPKFWDGKAAERIVSILVDKVPQIKS